MLCVPYGLSLDLSASLLKLRSFVTLPDYDLSASIDTRLTVVASRAEGRDPASSASIRTSTSDSKNTPLGTRNPADATSLFRSPVAYRPGEHGLVNGQPRDLPRAAGDSGIPGAAASDVPRAAALQGDQKATCFGSAAGSII